MKNQEPHWLGQMGNFNHANLLVSVLDVRLGSLKHERNYWYHFSIFLINQMFIKIMSNEMRRQERGDKDINRTAQNNNEQENLNGFEGMNFEQIRQPYNTTNNRQTGTKGERSTRRPDEA